MTLPALIICDAENPDRRIAGLTILDRLIIAAHRAGVGRINVVSAKPIQPTEVRRSRELGIAFESATRFSLLTDPTLVLSNRALVQATDLKRLMQQPGRLVTRSGARLPVGLLDKSSSTSIENDLFALPSIVALAVAESVVDEASARHVERVLWASMNSSADGTVDKFFNRPVGRFLSKLLVHTSATPNQVSVVATILGVVSAWFMAQGDYSSVLVGAVLFQISAIIDCVDGELARIVFKESAVGKWLDIVGDQVVHIAVFLGVGIGLYRSRLEGPVLALAISAAVGVLISFAVVMIGQRSGAARRNPRLQKLIDATTNRDFSVVLLALAGLNKLPWFLWMSAIGVHVFWVAALAIQFVGSRNESLKSARESGC